MLTFDAYVNEDGNRCPFCESDESVHMGDSGFDWGIAWSTSVCHQCGAEWTEEYEMARVTYNDGTENL